MTALSTRSRPTIWFGAGAVLTLLATLLVVGAWRVDADPGDADTTFVPIAPCRLFDTRDAGDVPFGPNVWRSFMVHGKQGNCDIPTTAVGVSMNVTAVDPTMLTFLTIYPDDAPTIPLASNLNPAPGQPPTPNAVTTELSPGGRFRIYNLQGVVDVVVDINGYHVKTSLKEMHQRLAALEARDPEVVVAHAESGNVDEAIFGGGASADVLTVNMTAPAAGKLFMTGQLDTFLFGSGDDRIRCDLVLDGTFIGGSAMYVWPNPPENPSENCVTTVTAEVNAGTHTVVLRVLDRATANFDDASLSVFWVRNS